MSDHEQGSVPGSQGMCLISVSDFTELLFEYSV